jgi:GAF domain-containing protein
LLAQEQVMPEHPDRLVPAMRELSRLMLTEEGVDATLQRIAGLATRTIPSCTMASLTIERGGRLSTPVCTDPIAAKIDKAQYDADTGPCVDAARDHHLHRVDSTSEDQRWRDFTKAAAAEGIGSSLSLPLAVDGKSVGALNLYADNVGAFSDSDEELGLLFAEQAALACLQAERYWQTYNMTQHLEEALKSRDVIGQAKGIIMAKQRVTADAAFDLLRRASQRRNVKIRDLADEVAVTGVLPEE